jgi:hypothetical protein
VAQLSGPAGSYALTRMRVVALNPSCNFYAANTPNKVHVTDVMQRLSASAETEDGTEYVSKNGNGDQMFVVRASDRDKRMNLEIDMAAIDLEGVSLLTGATAVIDEGGNVVGVERQGGCNPITPPKSSIEVWTNAGEGCGDCVSLGGFGAWRFVYPNAKVKLGDVELQDDVFTLQLRGFSETNPNWGTGPADDYPGVDGLGEHTLEALVAETGTLPAAALGLQAMYNITT